MNTAAPSFATRVEVDGWTIDALDDGHFRLDGGAMWGVVPANIWRALTPPAEDNTIRMSLRPFLARRGDRVVVIEGGVGARWSDKLRRIYHIEGGGRFEESLARLGVARDDVTDVVLSHCHWDHVGALVVDGLHGPEPLCPRARHHALAVEIERCLAPDHVRRGSYRPEDLLPLRERGLLVALETRPGGPEHPGEAVAEPVAGIRVHVLGGHSEGVSAILVGDGDAPGPDRAAVFWSDVVPTTHHIQPPYIMAYDIDVIRSYEVRGRWLERAAERGWIGLFYHDPDVALARLVRDGRRFLAVPLPA